jgi:hypothetical protein
MSILENELLTLSVVVSNPHAEGTWYKDGIKVEENDNITIEVVYSFI